jgi:signal transduction histidine kinase
MTPPVRVCLRSGAASEPPGLSPALARLGWSSSVGPPGPGDLGGALWLIDGAEVAEVDAEVLSASVVVHRPQDRPFGWAALETAALDAVAWDAEVDEWVARLAAAQRRWSDTQAARRAISLVTHDLNNPLAALRILSELFSMDAAEPEQRRDAQDMLEAVDAASVLVEMLHAWGAAESDGVEQEFDAFDLVHQALDRACFRRHAEVHPSALALRVRGRPTVVRGALAQVFWNAKRLTAEGRRFRVSPSARGVVVVSDGIEMSKDAAELLLAPHGHLTLRDQRVPVSPVGLAAARAALASQGASLRLGVVPGGLETRIEWKA